MGRALDMVMAERWAITEEALGTILAIAQRANESPETVAAKLGRPLENTRSVEIRDSIAVVPVMGPIFRRANLFTEISGATSLDILARDFNSALSDASVEAIVLDISSPGGQASGISEFAAMVRDADKRVIAYVSDIAASAAYWIASAADEIVISDTAMLGSIGVVSSHRATDDGEIKIISSQSPLKQATPETIEGKAEVQRVVDDLAAVFISSIANYRETTEETVINDFGRGGVLVGAKAVAVGMADRIGSFESTIAGLSGSKTLKEGYHMTDTKSDKPEITRDYLAAEYPDIVTSLIGEGKLQGFEDGMKEGLEQGALMERERIQSVESQAMPGHEKLINQLKYDGKSTDSDAALAILKAEKQFRVNAISDAESETPSPVTSVSDQHDSVSSDDLNLTVEARCKAQWEKDTALRAEFGDLDTYIAYTKAEEAGQVRRIGGKS